MIGLSDEEKEMMLWELASSVRLHAEAEEVSPQRKAYNNIIKSMTERFNNAIKSNNYLMIFDLEEIAQEHDAEYYSVNKSKSQSFYSTLSKIKEQFFEFAESPEKIRTHFQKDIKRLKIDSCQISDGGFDTNIKSLCGFINSFKSPRCLPSENAYYDIRSQAMGIIQKAHQRNINVALGYTKEREQSKDLGR